MTRCGWCSGRAGDAHAARPAPALLRLDVPTVWAAVEATLEQTPERGEAGRRTGGSPG